MLRIEITNPGGLVSAIVRADFGKRSLSRNPLIFGLFARMQLVEQVGSGIIRMNNLMKDAGLPLPKFNTEGIFTIILQRPPKVAVKTDKLGDKLGVEENSNIKDNTKEKILAILSKNNTFTIPEIAKRLNLSEKGVEYHISKMKKEGILTRIGSRKSGYWQISLKTDEPK